MAKNKDSNGIDRRIRQVLDYHLLSSFEFSQRIGDKRSEKLKRILDGEGFPSFDMLRRIKLNFPSINLNWLVTGSGDMVNENVNIGGLRIAVRSNARSTIIPFVSVAERKRYLQKYNDPTYLADLPVLDDTGYNDGIFRDFEVSSEANSPLLEVGDVVRGRLLDHEVLNHYSPEKIYILVFPSEILMRKLAKKGESWEMRPINKEFERAMVSREVLEVWSVVEIRGRRPYQ